MAEVNILTLTGNEYLTPGGKSSLLPSFSFYRKFLGIILNSSALVDKNLYDGKAWAESSLNILNSLEESGVRLSVKGLNYLTRFAEPAVIISNHMSSLETVILPSIINPRKRVVFIMKKELVDYPFFGKVTAARHPIIVGRANPREDLETVFNEGAKRLADGRSVIVFPQKTRSAEFEPSSFNTIGIKLAKKNNCRIIPLALLTDAWSNGKMVKDFGKIDNKKTVHIEFGEPFFVEGNGSAEHNRVLEFIGKKLKEWNREDLIRK